MEKGFPGLANWCGKNAEHGNVLCVSCRQWCRMGMEPIKGEHRIHGKRNAQARVAAGLSTPKQDRKRLFDEQMAKNAALKEARAKEAKTAS